ncbi:MAG: GWxTD domain-containing protein [Ignavibacteriales bacterium]|nr:GWxTD domain-containing protein [Ignavibacteriales bacterium]MCK7518294.1 GWxTD domain-containing protein [Ignavibacteriales bacterium]
MTRRSTSSRRGWPSSITTPSCGTISASPIGTRVISRPRERPTGKPLPSTPITRSHSTTSAPSISHFSCGTGRTRITARPSRTSGRRSLSTHPTLRPHNGLGTALAKAGDMNGAIASWEKAIAIDPNLPFPLYNLGAACLACGEKDKALDYLLRYKKIAHERLSSEERRKLDDLIGRCGKILDRRKHAMKAGHPRILLLLAAVCALSASQQKIKEKDLPEKYRGWLNLTSYISLPAEREVFFQLQTDRDRDIFIDSFWKQRDPTPETPQNEFRDEHLRRFSYANTNLGRSTPREGWRTDMGRMHIILGPASSIEKFDSQPGVVPCQVWYYRGEANKRLPTLFALVFYQRGGSGEYKLYNPAADGPASLLIRPEQVDQTDYEAVYKKIKELTPSLAPVVLSFIPGEFPYSFIPSPRAASSWPGSSSRHGRMSIPATPRTFSISRA